MLVQTSKVWARWSNCFYTVATTLSRKIFDMKCNRFHESFSTDKDCGANAHNEIMRSPCQPSCTGKNPLGSIEDCKLPPSEGCVCDEGYRLSNEKCVLQEDCGCEDEVDGQVIYYTVSTLVGFYQLHMFPYQSRSPYQVSSSVCVLRIELWPGTNNSRFILLITMGGTNLLWELIWYVTRIWDSYRWKKNLCCN